MSDPEFDFDQLPSTLDLLGVVIPKTQSYYVDGLRVLVPSIEYWNTSTLFRLVWPVAPKQRPIAGPIDIQDGYGHSYGFGGGTGGGSGSAADAWEQTYRSGKPIPEDVDTIVLHEDGRIIRIQVH